MRVLGDTSAIVAYFDGNDLNHNKFRMLVDKIVKYKLKLLITDYIFDECITTILSRVGHYNALKAGEFILGSKIIELVWLDESIIMKAWEYFKKHADKEYSFTDCTSFILMKEMKINDYFAFDDDFSKAGFVDFSIKYT